jgi:hypothetical protein
MIRFSILSKKKDKKEKRREEKKRLASPILEIRYKKDIFA